MSFILALLKQLYIMLGPMPDLLKILTITVHLHLQMIRFKSFLFPPRLRLIQFPPPPLKGGITVTMEDLQCLDSGQFLNDVIIDFYLK